MRIKHGNKVLREQQSDLREKIRWTKTELEEANFEIARLKETIVDQNKRIVIGNSKLRSVLGTNRKLRALMNDALQEDVFSLALEFAVTKTRTNFIEDLSRKFTEEVAKEV